MRGYDFYQLPTENLLRISSLVSETGLTDGHIEERKYYIARDMARSLANKIAADRMERIDRKNGLTEYRLEVFVLRPEELMHLIRHEALKYERFRTLNVSANITT
jgi:hypothetical protein